jgi:hypothetical protein
MNDEAIKLKIRDYLVAALTQVDEAQPLCPSPGCDILSNAGMNIDNALSLLRSQPVKAIKLLEEAETEAGNIDTTEFPTHNQICQSLIGKALSLLRSQLSEEKPACEMCGDTKKIYGDPYGETYPACKDDVGELEVLNEEELRLLLKRAESRIAQLQQENEALKISEADSYQKAKEHFSVAAKERDALVESRKIVAEQAKQIAELKLLPKNIETHIEMLMETKWLEKIGADNHPRRSLSHRIMRILESYCDQREQIAELKKEAE